MDSKRHYVYDPMYQEYLHETVLNIVKGKQTENLTEEEQIEIYKKAHIEAEGMLNSMLNVYSETLLMDEIKKKIEDEIR
tara:strand:+ start:8448 stop:8684 length:237 start_codon:yes stop_codon:yes gene_type:complete